MSVLKAIRTILNVSAVTNLATGGMYSVRATQGAVAPYIIYRVQDVLPNETKDGVSDVDEYFIVVESYAKTYAAAEALSDMIRTTMDGYSGTVSGIIVNTIVFEDKADFYDDAAEAHHHEQDFMVRINNS